MYMYDLGDVIENSSTRSAELGNPIHANRSIVRYHACDLGDVIENSSTWGWAIPAVKLARRRVASRVWNGLDIWQGDS